MNVGADIADTVMMCRDGHVLRCENPAVSDSRHRTVTSAERSGASDGTVAFDGEVVSGGPHAVAPGGLPFGVASCGSGGESTPREVPVSFESNTGCCFTSAAYFVGLFCCAITTRS